MLLFQCELGNWRFKSKSQGIYHEGYMFPLLVTEQLSLWPEQNVRRRAWVSVLLRKKKLVIEKSRFNLK